MPKPNWALAGRHRLVGAFVGRHYLLAAIILKALVGGLIWLGPIICLGPIILKAADQ